MECPFCYGEIPLPERKGLPAYCEGCDRYFSLADDYGWWNYSAEVYVPEEEDE